MTKRPFRSEEGDVSFGMARALILLSRGGAAAGDEAELQVETQQLQQHHAGARVFECKTCNRQFPSFQALGGHRASHKKPRLMMAGPAADGQAQAPPAMAKPRVHECSICGLEFAIGQALGGHMRRHRSAPAEGAFPVVQLLQNKTSTAAAAAGDDGDGEKRPPGVLCLDLDLNQPPAEDVVRCALSFSLGPPVICLH